VRRIRRRIHIPTLGSTPSSGGGAPAFDGEFQATFDSGVDADVAAGSATGTLQGSATVSDGYANIIGGSTTTSVDYDAHLNADFAQQGCINIKVVPQYSGTPTVNKQTWFITTRADGNGLNQISVWHNDSTGTMQVYIRSTTGTAIVNYVGPVWNPTASQEYEIELNWDVDTGATRLFIDGTQFGTTQTGTGTRDADNALFRLGNGASANLVPNFKVNEVRVWDTVQHTSDY
jgi:hypothetical protein